MHIARLSLLARWAVGVVAFSCLTSSSSPLRAVDEPHLPAVQIENIRRAYHNGEHNAFTDLCRFRDRLYLTFRSCPDGHMVFPSSAIIVLSSDDGRKWQEVHRFSVPKRDVRDPHFLVFQDKLFVYTGTWYCGDAAPKTRDMNEHLGYAAWTADGVAWQSPIMLEGTYGHYIWRAAAYGGKAYLCGRRKHHFQQSKEPEPESVESALLASDDGLIFSKVGLFQETAGDETAFLFEPNGDALAIARGGGRNRNAELCRARPPYRDWQRLDLGRQVGGPLVVDWKGNLLVGGRRTIGEARTVLYWLADDKLHEIAELPSGGDNSYPGFVPLGDGRALLSYYSSHESDAAGKSITAIYLADLTLEN